MHSILVWTSHLHPMAWYVNNLFYFLSLGRSLSATQAVRGPRRGGLYPPSQPQCDVFVRRTICSELYGYSTNSHSVCVIRTFIEGKPENATWLMPFVQKQGVIRCYCQYGSCKNVMSIFLSSTACTQGFRRADFSRTNQKETCYECDESQWNVNGR